MFSKVLLAAALVATTAQADMTADQGSIEQTNQILSGSTQINIVSDKVHARGVMSVGSYYDWGQGQNGWGYCYEWTYRGEVLNGGYPVGNHLCEYNNPSHYDWGVGRNGYGYCYQWTPYRVAMNEGAAQNNYSCEIVNPSYYAWGQGMNGYTYCYQYTPYGYPMNGGAAMPNSYCY